MAGMRRRDFIAAVGSTAVAWPARAQQGERMRRIGVLMNVAENDPAGQRRIAAFLQRLQELDWEEGRNLRIDMRWGAGDSDRYRRYAAELVALTPAAIFAVTTPAVAPLLHASRTVPIVFVSVVDGTAESCRIAETSPVSKRADQAPRISGA
jgi:putative ABC transport system substrate-binding protein